MTKKQKVKDSSRTKLEHRRMSLLEMCSRVCATLKGGVVFSMLRKDRKKILISVFVSVALLLICYFANNSSLPLNGNESFLFKIYEQKIHKHDQDSFPHKDFTFINVGYDIETIPYCYENSRWPIGQVAIINRKDLYDLLRQLSTIDYKYILLDVVIDDVETAYNDSIKSLLSKMNKVCVARTKKSKYYDHQLDHIAGSVNYRKSLKESSFAKYILWDDNLPSMPLKMYLDLNVGTFSKKGPFYFDGRHLCQRMLSPTFYIKKVYENEEERDYERGYFLCQHLGTEDIYKIGTSELDVDRLANFNNTIIVIGDFFENDVHETYCGEMSGSLINLNTYISLCKGEHHVNFFVVFILFAIYFCMSLWVLYMSDKKMDTKGILYRILNSRFYSLTIGLLGFSSLFIIISIILYVSFSYKYYTLLPTLYFTFFSHFFYPKTV